MRHRNYETSYLAPRPCPEINRMIAERRLHSRRKGRVEQQRSAVPAPADRRAPTSCRPRKPRRPGREPDRLPLALADEAVGPPDHTIGDHHDHRASEGVVPPAPAVGAFLSSQRSVKRLGGRGASNPAVRLPARRCSRPMQSTALPTRPTSSVYANDTIACGCMLVA